MLPQAGADGILADTLDALRLASGHRPLPKEGSHEAMHQPRDVEATRRPVVAIGASSGFSLPVMAVQSLLKSLDRSLPLPAALVSFSGITTFQHPFFKSSTLLTPQPVTDEEVAQFVRPGEAVVGKVQPYDTMVFHTDMLDREGRKNASFTRPAKPEWPEGAEADREDKYWQARSMLYDYYLYKNEYPVMMADVDPGFEWAKDEANAERKKAWPPTIIIHGDKDVDVDLALATHMVECLGEDKVKLILAKNQEHMPGLTKFLEDDNGGMDAIRQSLSELDKILNVAKD